jgi:glycosyltransferase involved in cell wall biosynthesis
VSLFSVVIPVYNGAGYIARSVGSALRQRGVRTEVIVIDDGSTDGSGAVAANVDASVRVHRCVNGGQAAARNLGITLARGEFVAFLDADDWWEGDKLQAQDALFQADPALHVVFSDFRGVGPDGSPSGWQGGLVEQLPTLGLTLTRRTDDGYSLSGRVADALICHTSFMHPSTMVVRRSVLIECGGFDATMSPAEDLELWIRLARDYKAGFVGRVVATVDQRPGSQGRQFLRMSEQVIRLYSGLRERSEGSWHVRSHIERYLEARHVAAGWHYRQAGKQREARRHYWAALRKRPRLRTAVGLVRTYLPSRARRRESPAQ